MHQDTKALKVDPDSEEKWLSRLTRDTREFLEENSSQATRLLFWCDSTDWLHPTRAWRKLSNVVRWVPLLWRDVDWDHSSLYEVVEFKLANMRAHQLSHGNHDDCDEVARQMGEAATRLRRVREDDYLGEEWKAYGAKYPRKPMGEWEQTPEGHRVMPEMPEEQSAEFRKLCEREEFLIVRDLDEFGKIFAEKSRGWWD